MFWAVYFVHRLWQQSLSADAAPAIDAGLRAGLQPWSSTYWPRVVLEGEVEQRAVRVEWRGGLLGLRSRLTINGVTRRLPFIASAEALQALLTIPEGTNDAG